MPSLPLVKNTGFPCDLRNSSGKILNLSCRISYFRRTAKELGRLSHIQLKHRSTVVVRPMARVDDKQGVWKLRDGRVYSFNQIGTAHARRNLLIEDDSLANACGLLQRGDQSESAVLSERELNAPKSMRFSSCAPA